MKFILFFFFIISASANTIISIDQDDYYFTLEEIERAEELEKEFKQNKCLSGPPQATCKCNLDVLSAKIKALKGDVHFSPNDPIGKRIKSQQRSLDGFSKAGKYQIKRVIGGESCLPFGSYKTVTCNSPKGSRGQEKYQSCACYEKWIRTNIIHLSSRIKKDVIALKKRSADDSFMDSLIQTSVSTIKDCTQQLTEVTPKTTCHLTAQQGKGHGSNIPRMRITENGARSTQVNHANRIKDKKLKEVLCLGDDDEVHAKKEALFHFIGQDYNFKLYNNSTIKKDVAALGDQRFCLLPINKMAIAKRKIRNFDKKYGNIAAFQFSCRFAGLTLSSFCHDNDLVQGEFRSSMKLQCSRDATGFVQLPPYGQGTPSPYLTKGVSGKAIARTGIEIKKTDACEFLMRSCEQLAKKVNYKTPRKTDLQQNIIQDFLKPLMSLKYQGKSAATACHGSEPTLATQLLEQAKDSLLEVDVKGNLTSITTSAVKVALYSNPVLKQIFENGGEEILSLIISSIMELRYNLTSIDISPYSRSGEKRSTDEIKSLYNKEYKRKLEKSIATITNDTITMACESVEGPKQYVHFFSKTPQKSREDLRSATCGAIIEKFGISEVISQSINSLLIK